MREISYKAFSRDLHNNKSQLEKTSMCHFELTFRCNFKCKYCYVAGQEKNGLIRSELSTKQVKLLLDKVYETGAFWLCLTGGEPFMRKDFLEIYDYAKRKGFIISILTNASLLDEEKIAYFKKFPPFSLEITLNSVSKNTFERISGVKGSFSKVMRMIKLLSKNKINFFLKAVIIKDNVSGLLDVEKFARSLDVKFRPSLQIFPRLNKDKAPCLLRISPQRAMELDKKLNLRLLVPESCFENRSPEDGSREAISIFPCGAGTRDQVSINPYGEMFFCLSIREIKGNILNKPIESCFKEFAKIRQIGYRTQSRCRYCNLKLVCSSCPGRSYLETQDMEAPVEWCCELTHLSCGKVKEPALV